ncbi:MAG: cell envelope protein SmpA [Dinoroseobacter sp.]|jgi:outer membrane protein assembly factor BamE (lipoprotein component of BamABCDE complex)|nr:cell envelope protein SmpA [Dinoroseobacter sp.]MAX73843.1 cell envelope protein SmpA [Nioella sp.]
MRTHPKGRRVAVALALAVGLAACTPTFVNHGYTPPADELAQITPGSDTRESVAELVGQPTASGIISGDTWYYVASRQRFYTYNRPEVIERDIVAITFDGQGRVQNIRELGLEDGEVVRLSRRVTESNIQEVTFMRQLLGNFGRINLSDTLNNL